MSAQRAGGMRMAELSERSGVARETIHFYLREGLLPRPRKGGRTVAFYDQEHLERLRLIRRLRDEKYLPLAVIRRLLASGSDRASGRDLDTFAEVIHIDTTLARDAEPRRAVPSDVQREAVARGLLGRRVERVDPADPTERRVLAAIEEALGLGAGARSLTLDDMGACAEGLADLCAGEAALFFQRLVDSGDVPGSIEALRAGRGAVARFVAAFRDLMLRRIVDEVLASMERGTSRTSSLQELALSAARAAKLGAAERRRGLGRAAKAGEPGAAQELAWHLFGMGLERELSSARLSEAALDPRARVLCRWARVRAGGEGELAPLQQAVRAADPFPLGEILLAQAVLDRLGSRGPSGGGFVEEAVPALHAIAKADPASDPDPLAATLGLYRRGRVELALPHVLGRRGPGLADLARAIDLAALAPTRVEPAVRARLGGNARLAMARGLADEGKVAEARENLARALAIDEAGPIGRAAKRELERLG